LHFSSCNVFIFREQKALQDAKIMAQKRAQAWIQAKKVAKTPLLEAGEAGTSEWAGSSRRGGGDQGKRYARESNAI
jgi:hypothetical protein